MTPDKAKKATGELREKIRTKDEWALGALMRLYSLQEQDEQAHHVTKHQNHVGFNSVDAEFLTSLAQQYEHRGWLTEKQMNLARRKLAKYARQLQKYGMKPQENLLPKERKNKHLSKERKAELVRGKIKILFHYNHNLVNKVKTLSGRKAKKTDEGWYWTAPVCYDTLEKLQDWGFQLDEELLQIFKQYTEVNNIKELEIPGLCMKLFPFQKEGVNFIEAHNGRVLLGDQMGLGKTAQALAWLQLHPELRPAVVVCPASVKLNWKREIRMWMGKDITIGILSGRFPSLPEPTLQEIEKDNEAYKDILIINYDIIYSWLPLLQLMKIKVLILDECHYIKNRKAKRTKVCLQLSKFVPHVLCLSGTPILNRPSELYTSLQALRRDIFSNWWRFANRYCAPKNTGFGWDFSGASNTRELNEKLQKTVMIRRIKSDVLKDLPPKIRTVIPLEMKNRSAYEAQERELKTWMEEAENPEELSKKKKAEALVRIEKMKQAAVIAKTDGILDWVRNFLESEDQKLVIFATHHTVIDMLQDKLSKHFPAVIDGRTPTGMRQGLVDRFQNSDACSVFIGNIKAAGVGITLTAASTTCFVELGWTPGEHDQAEDRVHRIGQSESVNAYYLLADNSVETEIAQLLDRKRRVLDMVLDGKEAQDIDLLTELLHQYTKKQSSS